MTKELEKQTEVLPPATLAGLPERLRRGAARAGWSELMPVQAQAIPYLFARRDMMIQSRTGSGKTGAFLMPILELVNPEKRATQALVLVPTRELAQQVAGEAEILGRTTGVRSIAVYGGVGYGQQLAAFKAGAHLVIGTPGRILDHLLRRSLSLYLRDRTLETFWMSPRPILLKCDGFLAKTLVYILSVVICRQGRERSA